MGSSIWLMRLAVGQRGHVTLHRHLLLHGSLVFGECHLLVKGLGVRLATRTRCKSLNYTAAGTDVKIHIVNLLRVSQMINFWPSFYTVMTSLFFCLSVLKETSLSHSTYSGHI